MGTSLSIKIINHFHESNFVSSFLGIMFDFALLIPILAKKLSLSFFIALKGFKLQFKFILNEELIQAHPIDSSKFSFFAKRVLLQVLLFFVRHVKL
ncbi:hypothetical protein MCY_00002 [Bartonella rattimassiliensis 15908]|uniref:Uncharacterized protein n=1 Tax=Bartonella rattimassiliensis 15908 TaxID=1094556 RepID=J1JU42_9HYPH|nr:hypothetical protein MCY_00002 [Bartonella rattimassiliensis 15908]